MMSEINDIITGVIGGIIVALIGWGVSIFKQYKGKRRFPVEGEYLTYFEDIEEGSINTVTALSDLKQKGYRVIGKTTMPTGRSWTIDGTILGTGHIAGVYSADASYDEGVGSFYLKINGDILEGMWSGFDHDNKVTSSGRYYFKKKASIIIRNADHNDISHILSISMPLFGEGYLKDIHNFINNKNGISLVAEEKGMMVAFLLGKSCLRDEAKSFFYTNCNIPADVNYSDKEGSLGIIKTIGVKSNRQGHGIGAALFKKAESDLKSSGTKTVIVPAWVIGSEANIRGIMEHFGYHRFMTDLDYWKKECKEEKFKCPAKENDVCVCSLDYYKRSL